MLFLSRLSTNRLQYYLLVDNMLHAETPVKVVCWLLYADAGSCQPIHILKHLRWGGPISDNPIDHNILGPYRYCDVHFNFPRSNLDGNY